MGSAAVYEAPSSTTLLSLSSFLFLIRIADALFERMIHAGLIGSLIIGGIYGPQVGNILPQAFIDSIIMLGYIGLIILVFEAGLTTNTRLLVENIFLSSVAAATGIIAPIGLSMLLLCVGYGYTPLQSFAAGAALSATSLGTTLALLKPEYRQSRAGSVLMSAALLDDVVGLVIAAIIKDLSNTGTITWRSIVQPILVSFAFVLVVPLASHLLNWAGLPHVYKWIPVSYQKQSLLFAIVAVLSGIVAAAHYAGASDLLGAYLAGVFFNLLEQGIKSYPGVEVPIDVDLKPRGEVLVIQLAEDESFLLKVFSDYIVTTLHHFLSPMFFASIGTSLPIRALGVADRSSAVVWRGIVYSLVMFFSKVIVGVTIFVWPVPRSSQRRITRAASATFSRPEAAAILGLAMVARGEIALIIAQLGQPILTRSGETQEAYAVVIWAILLCTIGGAVCVGVFLRWKDKRSPGK